MKTLENNRRAAKQVFVTFLSVLLTVGSPFAPVHAPMNEAQAEEPVVVPTPKEFAANLAWNDYKWGGDQFACLESLWTKESHWNHLADNPHSSAFGIAQMLGEDSRIAEIQITNGLRYIEHRYDTPCAAWSFWKRNFYY
jgi:hypothetical protein